MENATNEATIEIYRLNSYVIGSYNVDHTFSCTDETTHQVVKFPEQTVADYVLISQTDSSSGKADGQYINSFGSSGITGTTSYGPLQLMTDTASLYAILLCRAPADLTVRLDLGRK